MSEVRVELLGADKLKQLIAKYTEAKLIAIKRATIVNANLVRNAAIKKVRTKGTGRTYTRGNITHVASSPGNPPVTDTGGLIRGIVVDTEIVNGIRVVGVIKSRAVQSAILEYGGRVRVPNAKKPGAKKSFKIEARPFMRPSVRENSKQFIKNYIKAIRKGI